MTPFNFAERICEECRITYRPRSRTQRWCAGCSEVERQCPTCGARFSVPRHHLSKRLAQYCSTACRRRFGGLHFTGGRWSIICRDGSKCFYYHAVVMAYHGRELQPGEVVHHRNGDPTDDCPENLEVMTTGDHVRLHWRLRKGVTR